jgi:glyceraldehyde-3-phosphate dehydrogenase (ferredoxin)
LTYPINQRELTVHLHNGSWYLRPIEGLDVLGPVDYGWKRYNLYPDSFTFGEGLLAGSSIPGSRRLFFCGWSPQWDGFTVSSMGGAAYTYHHLGVNYVALRGRAAVPSVLLLNHKDGEVFVRLEPVHIEAIWSLYVSPAGDPLYGFYALQQALFDRYAGEYPENKLRIAAVGPAALHTQEGAIGSSPVRKGAFSPVVDWAGRGGLGSRLLQYHNLAGIVFGGTWEDPDLRDSKEIDAYFLEHFGQRTIQTDLAVTEKYRYFPQFETGGTFGVNMRELGDRILSFNYRSLYATPEERLQQHQRFILEHYLAQFNEETIQTKSFQHCGEPCAVVCKKMRANYKKDYEPYHVLGPQIGVFDQRAAERINDHVDAMGFDAIQCGGTLAWIMELVAEGLIDPVEYGFPPADQLKFRFTADPAAFDRVADSDCNADYAIALVDALIHSPQAALFRRGIRAAAETLERQGVPARDRAVYYAHGDEGCMVPNQYWVPGMLSPMPVMGKYYVYYGGEFVPPRELGRKNVERMTYELFNDNSGICRFHRKWAEVITDYKAHQYELAREIYRREGGKAVPWESERVIDLVHGYLRFWQAQGLRNPEFDHWLTRFTEDKLAAARAYWEEIRLGIEEAFDAGHQVVPNVYSQGQIKRQAAG